MNEYSVVVESEIYELVFDDALEINITGDESFDLILEGGTELVMDNSYIEVLEVSGGEPGPPGQPGTKITVSETPPLNPRIGDLWIVKT